MKKILLVCNAGMSTSMLASKMQGVATEHGLPIEVEAFPDGKIAKIVEERHPDVILLGPQVRYKLNFVKEIFPDKPVEVIDMAAYGMMDGAAVVKRAQKLMEG